ncbi:MAG: hypothetical protein KDK08_08485 [Rhizobiaceae bacterium]|nr:hypothetical protein [Rhizobiaceae bacterium]
MKRFEISFFKFRSGCEKLDRRLDILKLSFDGDCDGSRVTDHAAFGCGIVILLQLREQ